MIRPGDNPVGVWLAAGYQLQAVHIEDGFKSGPPGDVREIHGHPALQDRRGGDDAGVGQARKHVNHEGQLRIIEGDIDEAFLGRSRGRDRRSAAG